MRTETVTYYTFDELSPQAQGRAIQDRREANWQEPFFWADEAMESIKEGLNAFGSSIGRYSIQWDNANLSSVPFSMPENVEELTGLRLRTWIINNAYSALRERKPQGKYYFPEGSKKGRYPRRSRIIYTDTSCPFTGVCYDESFLDPIRKFMAKPDPGTTFEELMEDAISAVLKDVESEIEYRDTDEAIREELEANGYEYTKNGKIA